MNLDFFKQPLYAAIGVGLLVVMGIGAASLQKACGKRHEDAALVLEGQAKEKDEQVRKLQAQVDNLTTRWKDAEAAGKLHQARYRDLLAKYRQDPVPEKPRDLPSYATALRQNGLQEGVSVVEHGPSTLGKWDADLVLDWRASLDRLEACDKALTAAGEVVANQESQIGTLKELNGTKDAQLTAALESTRLRQEQAERLTKALKNEQRKRWKRWALGIGGFVAGVYVGKK